MLGLLAAIFCGAEMAKETSEKTCGAINMDKLREDIINGVPPKIRQQKIHNGAYSQRG